jgi:hypothetical protein
VSGRVGRSVVIGWSSMLYQVNPWMGAMPPGVGEFSIISGL